MTTSIQTFALTAILSCTTSTFAGWDQLAPLPGKLGVAAPFAGVSGQTLLVGGGANFPDKAPWDGGSKVWYDTVYALDQPHGDWKPVGHLPRLLGYGVCVSVRGRMFCAGGCDAAMCYADAFWLDYQNGRVVTTALPPLPEKLANACAACVGDMLYVAGGQISPTANEAVHSVFRIDLSDAKAQWESIARFPGVGRILATAAALDGCFYVMGGTSLSVGPDNLPQRHYLSDAYRYSNASGWERIADLPNPIVAAPSPAPTDDGGIFILGGDDGSHAGFKPPALHPGFSKTILRFDQRAGTWAKAGETPAARVTVPCVPWSGQWVITSGEMRPGVRSPQVWMFNPEEHKETP